MSPLTLLTFAAAMFLLAVVFGAVLLAYAWARFPCEPTAQERKKSSPDKQMRRRGDDDSRKRHPAEELIKQIYPPEYWEIIPFCS